MVLLSLIALLAIIGMILLWTISKPLESDTPMEMKNSFHALISAGFSQ